MSRLGRANTGGAVIEYVVLLSVIAAFTGAMLLLSDQIRMVSTGLSHQVTGREPARQMARATGHPAQDASSHDGWQLPTSASLPTGLSAGYVLTVAIASTIVAIVGLGLLRRRHKRLAREPVEQPPPDALPDSLQARLFAKRQGLLRALGKDSEVLLRNRMEVRHLMTRSIVRVMPTTTTEEISSLMKEKHLRHLMVCREDGALVGVISDRDMYKMQTAVCSVRGKTAQDYMTSVPRTVAPDTLLSPAITFMINENISCLPVLQDGRLCGILTTTDLILTLQCLLQLWVQFGQCLQSDSLWSEEELDTITQMIDEARIAAGSAVEGSISGQPVAP